MHLDARLAAMGRTESPAGTLRGWMKAGQHTRLCNRLRSANDRAAANPPYGRQHSVPAIHILPPPQPASAAMLAHPTG